MRIRTDGEYEWRKQEIEALAEFYGVNKTNAVLRASEDVPAFASAVQGVLNRDDLTVQQRREIAERFDGVPGFTVEFEESTLIKPE